VQGLEVNASYAFTCECGLSDLRVRCAKPDLNHMNNLKLRREIIRTVQSFNQTGLSTGTSGNMSARTPRGLLVTPTGVPYASLVPGDLVELDMQGKPIVGELIPSSEWRIHRDIYRHRPEINAVVHVHSTYATALACTRLHIPAIHYHIALIGGDTVRCAKYATFGTKELSANALEALQGRLACLLANHGQVALGGTIAIAWKMAQEVEQLARLYCIASQVGKPILLNASEVKRNIEKFRNYGRQGK